MPPDAPVASPDWFRRLRRALTAWFAREARDLPWRRDPQPYRVWISEIMLQQTQVATVIPYFERFLAAFPTVGELAAAPEEQVLRLWEGLGYYRRARQLHAAAKKIVAEHDGIFPMSPDDIRALPGIGRYTAGAILSIAGDQAEPILEANTLRVNARLLGFAGDPLGKEGQRVLWEFAQAVLPKRGAGTINQALMELGALICTPREPKCLLCPVATLCRARIEGKVAIIPPPKRPKNFEALREAAVVVWRKERVLLRRCGLDERWAGLWDFPRVANEHESNHSAVGLVAAVARLTGVSIELGERLATLKHGVTRFRITLECHAATHLSGGPRGRGNDLLAWVKPSELEGYPLSSTGRKIARMIADRGLRNRTGRASRHG